MQVEVTRAMLDDIHECAAEMQGEMAVKVKQYEAYPTLGPRYQRDLEAAQRVLDWVDEVRKPTFSSFLICLTALRLWLTQAKKRKRPVISATTRDGRFSYWSR